MKNQKTYNEWIWSDYDDKRDDILASKCKHSEPLSVAIIPRFDTMITIFFQFQCHHVGYFQKQTTHPYANNKQPNSENNMIFINNDRSILNYGVNKEHPPALTRFHFPIPQLSQSPPSKNWGVQTIIHFTVVIVWLLYKFRGCKRDFGKKNSRMNAWLKYNSAYLACVGVGCLWKG